MSDPQDELKAQAFAQMRQAASELGRPLYGLSDPAFGDGRMAATAGRPCTLISLLYQLESGTTVGVTTALQPLRLLDLMSNVVQLPAEPVLPWSVSVDGFAHDLAVDGDPQRFSGVRASDGQWSLAGRAGERHVVVFGTPDVDLDGLGLVPVQMHFGDGTVMPVAR